MIKRNPQQLVEQQTAILNYLLRKIKELEKEIILYKHVMSIGQAGGGAAATADHGALTGLTDDDHTQYILADGTRAFTGAVDAPAAGYLTPNLAFYEVSSNSFQIMNRAKTTYKNLAMGTLTCGGIGTTGTTMYISTPTANNRQIVFRAGLNGVLTEMFRLQSHATSPSASFTYMRLPTARTATPVANDCRYDAATDTFEIYTGAAWSGR